LTLKTNVVLRMMENVIVVKISLGAILISKHGLEIGMINGGKFGRADALASCDYSNPLILLTILCYTECDLVFLHAPNFGDGMVSLLFVHHQLTRIDLTACWPCHVFLQGLDIHIRTKIRYSYSYIESAALRLGNDVIEVSSWGEYFVNGVSGAELPRMLVSGFSFSHKDLDGKTHIFALEEMGTDIEIVIKTFKEMVSVRMEPFKEKAIRNHYFSSSLGLMGSFDDEPGKLLARDGVTVIDDHNAFGQEWQVQDTEPMLFVAADRAPQYPAKCVLPSTSAAEKQRRLGLTVAQIAAEEACGHWEPHVRDLCIYDVMASGDLELAAAGGY
jgi:hypothetical protein